MVAALAVWSFPVSVEAAAESGCMVITCVVSGFFVVNTCTTRYIGGNRSEAGIRTQQ